jgi:imidazolonepropionase-like amidohydrolase
VKKFWGLTESMLQGMSPEQKTVMANRYKSSLSLVTTLQRSGIGLLAGTDSPVIPGVVAGFSLHEVLLLMVEAGLTPLQALQSATLNPAKFLGKLEELGTVEAGKLADLVLLEGDPRTDIRNLSRISAVVTQGRLLDRAALDALLRAASTAAQGN